MGSECKCPDTRTIWLTEGKSTTKCEITVKLVTLGSDWIIVDITDPCGNKYSRKSMVKDTILYYRDCDAYGKITVKCTSIITGNASFKVCYEKSPTVVCTDYDNMYDCHQANCYWWDGSCHSETKPVYDNAFDSIGNWFDTIYIPIIGSYIFKPVSEFFYTLSDWYNTVNSLLDTILSWSAISTNIKSTYDIVNHKWSEVTALIPTWSELVPAGFPTSLSGLVTLIKANAPGFPSWMPTSLSALITLIKANAPGFPSWMPTSLSALITLIKANAPGFPSWMPTSLSGLVTLIKANAPGFPSWMPTSLSALMTLIDSVWDDALTWISVNQDKILIKIDGIFNLVNLGRLPMPQHVKEFVMKYASGFPSWMPTSLSALVALIKANAPGFPTWMPTSLAALKTLIMGTAEEAYISVTNNMVSLFINIERALVEQGNVGVGYVQIAVKDFKQSFINVFDILDHKWLEVTALIPTWTELLPTGYPVTALNLINKIKTTVLGTYTSIDAWFDNKKGTVLGWVKAMFPYDIQDAEAFLTWLGITAGDVIFTILDTPAKMFEWLKPAIDNTYDILGHKWSEVTGLIPVWSELVPAGFPTSLSALIALIKANAPGFPSWMPTSLSDFKNKITLYVSDSFELILDYAFKEEN